MTIQGYAPLEVEFTDISYAIGTITNWLYDFGDGTTSTEQNPQHTYTEGGSFSPSLTITTADGEDTEIKLDEIVVYGFAASVRVGTEPLQVQFIPYFGDLEVTEYYWQFGDNKRSYQRSPSHVYKNGVYDVTLDVVIEGAADSFNKESYITVYPRGSMSGRVNTALRIAIKKEHGVGVVEIPKENFPMPESGCGTLVFHDNDNILRGIVLDNNDGLWYDITTRGSEKVWKNKVGIDGDGGFDFNRWIRFREDTGTAERHFIRHLISHIYVRPFDERNREDERYDSNGYLTDTKFSLDFFVDGNIVSAASLLEAPLNGELKTDKIVEGHRIGLRLTCNKGSHYVLNREQEYATFDRPTNARVTTEGNHQKTLTRILLWAMLYKGQLVNKRTGTTIETSGTQDSGATGISNTALTITEAQSFGSVDVAGGGVFVLVKGDVTLTIGGDVIALVEYSSFGAWSLYWLDSLTKSGEVIVTPSTTATIHDLRILSTALPEEAVAYYFTDIENNEGRIVL